jgi:hypothetical protein
MLTQPGPTRSERVPRLVTKVVYGPDRGDVIVFSDPKDRSSPDPGIVGGAVHRLSGAIAFEPSRPPTRVGWIH